MQGITFIEKEPWHDDSPFIGQCDMFPIYMVKGGREFFVINRRVPDDSWKAAELEEIKKLLIDTDGAYTKFNGIYKNPFEMLKEMAEREHTFREPNKLFIEFPNRGFVDFHGNRNEVSAAFHYRIYEIDLIKAIQRIAGQVSNREWEKAEHDLCMYKAK
ncbi:MAG: hypothetical protein NC124_18830 [Clostridium sp.]|nr:hypothetical protein [Clostridium sp.]